MSAERSQVAKRVSVNVAQLSERYPSLKWQQSEWQRALDDIQVVGLLIRGILDVIERFDLKAAGERVPTGRRRALQPRSWDQVMATLREPLPEVALRFVYGERKLNEGRSKASARHPAQ
jgi:hypothetical protein